MKKKFSKILGVGLTLALLCSLLLTAAPVSALSSATVTIPAADDEISFPNAEYSIFFTIHEELAGLDSVTFRLPDLNDTFTITAHGTVADSGTITVTAGSVLATPLAGATVGGAAVALAITPASGAVAWTTLAGAGTIAVADTTGLDTTTGTVTHTAGPVTYPTTEAAETSAVAAPPGGIFSLPDYDELTTTGDLFTITDHATLTDSGTITVTSGSVTATPGTGATVATLTTPVTITPASGAVAWTTPGTGAGDIAVEANVDGTTGSWTQTAGPVTVVITEVTEAIVLGALAADGDTITVTFPEDTVLAATVTANADIAASKGWVGTSYEDAVLASTAWSYVADDRTLTYTMKEGDLIGTSAQVMINITAGITNPTTPDDYTLTVETSQEDAEESEPYTINPPEILVPAGVVRVFNPSGIEFQPRTGDTAINDAIDNAGDDWLIVIGEGRYPTAIPDTGAHAGLTIRGAAGADVVIEAAMTVNSGVSATTEATFTLENVTIDGTLTLGADADSAVIDNCTFEGAGAIFILTGCDTPDITDCSFDVAALATGITCQGNGEADITGSSFTLADTAIAINVAAGADGGTVDDCTFTGGSGDGIILAGDTTVTDCTFDGLDWALQITGGTQVISGNTIQACEEAAIDVIAAVDVTITANIITGNNEAVLLAVAANAANVQMMYNDILDNAGDADGLLIDNNVTGVDLNCTNNWWGDPEGPGAAAFSDDVLSAPFLTASVGDTGVLGTNVAVDTLWDERTTAGVTLRAAGGVMEIVGAAQYADNPGAAIDGTALAFRDVCVIDTDNDVTEVTIRLYLAGITADTEAYVWAAARGGWLECSNYTPNLFGGFVLITVTDATSPTLEDLEELPFALVEPAPTTVLATVPTLLAPETGDDTVSLTPVFAWKAVAGADGYYFELADNANFVVPLMKLSGDVGRLIVTAYAYVPGLDYSTAYYWRVKAVSGTIEAGDLLESDWVSAVFITEAEPVEPADVILEPADIIIEPPDVIVTVPAETPITPAWIYVIIAVGAVLVIALLVLIVRTRRVA